MNTAALKAGDFVRVTLGNGHVGHGHIVRTFKNGNVRVRRIGCRAINAAPAEVELACESCGEAISAEHCC